MRPRMANLSALLQDLADRIASKEEGPHGCTQLDDDDPVVARFRSILPTLLQGYFAPSKVKERESMAILKLLCHTVTHYPAVFHHGKGYGVLPILGQIVPLLSQHSMSATHALLFETICALMSILRNGDKDIYRLFLSGALLLVQDLVSVATFFSSATHFTSSTSLPLQCYSAAYEMVYDTNVAVKIPLCQLPSQWTPPQGHGLFIHVTGDSQWLPLASWTLRLISHCLGEGALLVEGLLTFTFLEAVGILLCYGDSDLHKASFELVRGAASIMDPDLIPSDKLIMSLLSLLVESAGLLLPFRNNTYDSALASCLVALYSTSQAAVIECTAQTFMEVFPSAISRTTSSELRVALSETFCVILKHCPWYANHLGSLLQLAFNPELCPSLSHCIQLAVEVLGVEVVTGCVSKECIIGINRAAQGVGFLQQFCDDCCKWPVKDADNKLLKRQKLSSGLHMCKRVNCKAMLVGPADSHSKVSNVIFPDNEGKMVKLDFHRLFMKTIAELEPPLISLNIDNRLAALSTLARVCSHFPGAACSNALVQQLQKWIPWLLDKEGTLTVAQLSMFLEGTEKLISGQVHLGTSGRPDMQPDSASSSRANLNFLNQCSLSESAILDVVVLPWSISPTTETESPSRMKCRALSIAVKLGSQTDAVGVKIVLEHAFKDDDVAVRAAAVRTVPQLAAWSSPESIRDFCTQFCGLRMDGAEQVRYTVAETIGLVVCACYCRHVKQETWGAPSLHQSSCFCPICEVGDYSSLKLSADAPSSHDMEKSFIVKGQACLFALDLWRSCFEQLLLRETSENVQVAFIESMSRILRHMSIAELELTRADWLKCLDVLPLHDHRAVREAFSVQIHCFTEDKVLEGIFGSSDDSNTSNRDLQMLGKLKHALDVSKNPAVIETLLESVAEVAQAARHRRQLLFFSLVLLVEHVDSATVSVQVASVRLLHKIAAVGWPAAKSPAVQLMVGSVQEELFEYLCKRLITRPSMLTQVSEAVMSMETSEFLTQIVPVVLPKLILEQQHNPQALCILHELSRLRDTQLPLLLVEFCHQVLSVLLLRADGNELLAALQFYEAQTGSETRDLFAAVLPALLDELVRFLGDVDTGDALKRSARVAPMIQEVASIVTGSDDLPSFLRTHFVGLLNSIDRKLLRANDLTSQKQALRCIERLLDMIGQHLSAFVPKIMALLTRALQERSLQSDGLTVWLFFVQTLARVAPTALKHIASQIVVALMACLEAHLEEETPNLSAVVCVLEELIIRNRTVLDDQIRELPLLPSHPKLAKVNDVLHEARGLLSLRDQLQQAADGLGHESLSVRYTTARELSKWMRTKRKDIASMILGEMSLDATVINNLTTALLRGCGEESRTVMSQRLKMACAECLGELGAIDPAKLHVDLRHRSSIERSDEDLVFELINEHLAKVLRAAGDTDVQDAAALAIQELLKYSGCRADLLGGRLTRPSGSKAKSKLNKSEVLEASKRTPSMSFDNVSSTEAGEQLWRRFSEDVKEIITPCLTSKYHLKDSGAAIPDGPIFGSGLSFRRWIYLWIRRLVSQATGARAHIFIACRGVVRHDMGTALYLLPYLVLNVICHGSTEARDSVTKEILAVLAKADSSNTDSITPLDVPAGNVSRSWSGPSEMSTQAVFVLLDNLGQWLDDSKIVSSPATQVMKGAGPRAHMHDWPQVELSLQHNHAAELLDAIPKQALAGASFRCQAYARALLYFESYIRASSGALNPAAGINFKDEDLTLLLEIYSGLDEPDGLTGLSRLRKSMSLQDQILINEKAGNWAEALTCCEQALQLEPTSVPRHCGVLNCLLNMGHLRALVTHVDGLVLRLPDNTKDWSSRGVQAAWRLGQWNLLDEYVEGADIDGPLSAPADSNTAFDISLARILQALQKGDQVACRERLAQCRQSLLAPLAAASMESYTRAYPLIVKLHMLKELEDFSALTGQDGNFSREESRDGYNTDFTILNVIAHWEDRLQLTQQSLWTREPILALRRLVFKAIDMPSEVGNCWLLYAKLCRTAGHYETARCAILEAQSAGAANVHMEMAKLLWNTQKGHRAILELQQAIPPAYLEKVSAAAGTSVSETGQVMKLPKPAEAKRSMTSMDASQLRRDEHRNAAKTLLLLARWGHHTGQKHKEEILKLFYNVRELQPRWEKGFFYVAKYYDDLLVDARRRQEEGQDTNVNLIGAANQRQKASSSVVADDKPWWTYLSDAILYYAKALHRGHRRLFQALPRLLTLWFEFGSVYRDDTLTSVKGVKTAHVKLMNIMRGCLKELPSYQWLTALSQLVSRICHPNDDVVKLVKVMITTVIRAHPQQALWTMAAVSKSTVQARREAAAEVLKLAASGESDKLLFTQFTLFIEHMIKLCFYGGHPKAKYLSIATDFGTLKRMMPVRVIMPVQQALTVALPADGLTNNTFNPFMVLENSTIHGIKDEVEVLASLQRPKKVVLVSSDGIEHPFLCKPKDDLRKDARMMEFTTMINRLLSKDPKSRKRKLYIRTFAVIPLTEESGMIEWVLHTRGLRHVLQDLYVAAGNFDRKSTNNSIKQIYDQHLGQKAGGEMLRTKILPLFPPIFHRWFLNTFPEPAAWFRARIAYAHTSAVWSMVGHILGLGDRHGENILFDSMTGDCVHVDFSCLFDKGLTLEKPELVPFRLTQNMVDGLGITGYEGTFTRTCETTLCILRAHRETLMSVLETFIHDPLVEWTKMHKSSGVEVQNPHAQRAIANIEARLQGVVVGVGAAPSLPLSVEGQAHRLISEAVSHENLEKMYIWWMAWF